MSNEDVNVQIGAKIDGLLSALEQSKASLNSLASTAKSATATMVGGAEAVAAAFGASFLVGFIERMGEAGLQAERTAAMLGISTSAVSGLAGVAKLTGTSMDSMVTSIERLSLNVQRSTKDALGPQAQGLAVLGLRAKDLIGLPADQYFIKLADAVSQFNPSLNLTNALMAVGGRGIAQMIPALLQGSEGFRKINDAVKQAKGDLSGFAPAAAETHAKFALMNVAFDAFQKKIFLAVKPAIDGAIEWIGKLVSSLSQKDIQDAVMRIATWFVTMGEIVSSTFVSLGGQLADFKASLSISMPEIKLTGLALAVKRFAEMKEGTDTLKELVRIWDQWNDVQQVVGGNDKPLENTRAKIEDVKKWADQARAAIASMFNAGSNGDKVETGAKKVATAIDELARQRIQITAIAEDTTRAMIQAGFEREKLIINQKADLYRTTENQRYAALIASDQRAYEFERESLERKRALWKADPVQYATITKEIEVLAQQHQTRLLQLNQSSVKAQERNWDEMLTAMSSSFNGNLRGLLAGTTTWAQTWKALLGDMLIYFIQLVEKMALKWVAGQLAELTATQTTETAKVAATVAGTEATLPVRAAKFLSDITADAALVFAGIFASLAPLMGPAAAGPAAAGEATVLGQAAAVPKLDVGTDRVLKTGIALLHEGEKVVPAAQTSGPFSGGGGGGGITINAWDGASVANWLKRGGSELLLKHLSPTMDRNPSLRPTY